MTHPADIRHVERKGWVCLMLWCVQLEPRARRVGRWLGPGLALLVWLVLGPALAGGTTRAAPPAEAPPPALDTAELAVYAPALRPEFRSDLQRVAHATRYEIQASLLPGEPPRVVGSQRVRYANQETVALDDLVFRLFPNLPGFGGHMSVGELAREGVWLEARQAEPASVLHVPLRPALPPGATLELSMTFTATLPTDTSNGYALFAFADGVYALAGFYPIIPVYDDEGWNAELTPPYGDVTFTDVAFYRVTLRAPAELTLVTSGTVLEVVESAPGIRTWTAVAGPVRDFYIAASPDYGVISREVDGTRINSYYRGAQAAAGQQALEQSSAALRLYSRRFGDYPYAELDVVPTPTNAGGIEYPGVIVVAQQLYEKQDDFFELVIAHEAAHQWWYGLVGNDQVDEPWLDEALANYSAYHYFESTSGQARADSIRQHFFEEPYQQVQATGQDRGVAGSVASFDAASYGAIVYGKGPLFFDAVRQRLGDGAFFAALRRYLASHRYGIAYPADLVAAFEESSGQSIADLYRQWIEGQSG